MAHCRQSCCETTPRIVNRREGVGRRSVFGSWREGMHGGRRCRRDTHGLKGDSCSRLFRPENGADCVKSPSRGSLIRQHRVFTGYVSHAAFYRTPCCRRLFTQSGRVCVQCAAAPGA